MQHQHTADNLVDRGVRVRLKGGQAIQHAGACAAATDCAGLFHRKGPVRMHNMAASVGGGGGGRRKGAPGGSRGGRVAAIMLGAVLNGYGATAILSSHLTYGGGEGEHGGGEEGGLGEGGGAHHWQQRASCVQERVDVQWGQVGHILLAVATAHLASNHEINGNREVKIAGCVFQLQVEISPVSPVT